MILFAESDAGTGFLPDYFPQMLAALVIVYVLAQLLFAFGYRVIDWITPGNLNQELLGIAGEIGGPPGKSPNIALAIVVASMVLGTAVILGCTVIGVLTH